MALPDRRLGLLRLVLLIEISDPLLLLQLQNPVPEVSDRAVLPVEVGVQQVHLFLQVGHDGVSLVADHLELVD